MSSPSKARVVTSNSKGAANRQSASRPKSRPKTLPNATTTGSKTTPEKTASIVKVSTEDVDSARTLLGMLRHPGAVDGDRILAEFSAWLKQAQGCEAEARVMAEITRVRSSTTAHHRTLQ